MKILLVEDSLEHIKSAEQTLAGNELTVVETYDDALNHLNSEDFNFDVVLSDLMLPMSPKTLAPEVFDSDEEVPYGFVIALKAALAGAKFIAVVTDINHHQHCMSAALDVLGTAYWEEELKPNYTINGAKAFFVHAPFTDDGAKDWGKVLEILTQ